MRPPVIADDSRREVSARQVGIERIVVCNGGDAAQKVLHSADQEALIARNRDAGRELWIGSPSRIDVRNPFAYVTIGLTECGPRQAIELQVVVRIDETRQHTIALEVDYRVARKRVLAQRRDAWTHDAQAGDLSIAQFGIEERDPGRRSDARPDHFRARTTSTMGRPSQRL